jgi:hypothetical protein
MASVPERVEAIFFPSALAFASALMMEAILRRRQKRRRQMNLSKLKPLTILGWKM